MREVHETPLPGVGVRHEFQLDSGEVIGVVLHHSGERELFLYDRSDPDRVAATVTLDPEEAAILADLLGGTQVSRHVQRVEAVVERLALDWVQVGPGAAGRTIGELAVRRRTGATVVAVIRGDGTEIPGPGPEVRLEPGDTAVLVGTTEAVAAASALLSG